MAFISFLLADFSYFTKNLKLIKKEAAF